MDLAASRDSAYLRKAATLFFLLAFALVFGGFSVGRKMNVDENVFIASAALFAKGLHLYGDFHYNHMPTLVIIYSLLFRLTDHLVLAARTFSAVFAAGAAAIFFFVAYQNLSHLGPRRRLWFSIAIGLFFLANPLFTRTAGRSWNHDFPAFTSLLGFLAMSHGLTNGKIRSLILCGLLIGLAVTTRLTFATELLPFALFVAIYPRLSIPRRMAFLLAFTIGLLIAAAPSAAVIARSPSNAYFGNFQYPALNTQWHYDHDTEIHHRYTLPPKLWYFLKITWELPGNGFLFWGFIILMYFTFQWRQVFRDPFHCRLLILLLLAASQVAAGLVPSPPFPQYFYAATPFMLLGAILCMARLPNLATNVALNWVFIICLCITLGFGVVEYRGLYRLFWIPAWWPMKVHALAEQVARDCAPGPVLTIDPLYALEGGLDIYPASSTGPFGMRVADYLTAEQRQKYRMWGAADIDRLFAQNPPATVLISPGSDDATEGRFARDAQALGYHERIISPKNPCIILWTR